MLEAVAPPARRRGGGRVSLALSLLLLPMLGVAFILWTQQTGGAGLTGAQAWIPLWVVVAALVVQIGAMVSLAMSWLGS